VFAQPVRRSGSCPSPSGLLKRTVGKPNGFGKLHAKGDVLDAEFREGKLVKSMGSVLSPKSTTAGFSKNSPNSSYNNVNMSNNLRNIN